MNGTNQQVGQVFMSDFSVKVHECSCVEVMDLMGSIGDGLGRPLRVSQKRASNGDQIELSLRDFGSGDLRRCRLCAFAVEDGMEPGACGTH